jgi:hypothetical protein
MRRPGNERYHRLVKLHQTEYSILPRNERRLFADQIVDHLTSMNPPVRFVQKKDNGASYISVSVDVAIEKTQQALRERKRNKLGGADGCTSTKDAPFVS